MWLGVGKGPLGRPQQVLMSGESLFEPRAMRVGNLQFLRAAVDLSSVHGIVQRCCPAMSAWLGALVYPFPPSREYETCSPFSDDKFVGARRAFLRMFVE